MIHLRTKLVSTTTIFLTLALLVAQDSVCALRVACATTRQNLQKVLLCSLAAAVHVLGEHVVAFQELHNAFLAALLLLHQGQLAPGYAQGIHRSTDRVAMQDRK